MLLREFLALTAQARASSKSQLFSCRILSSMSDRIRFWCFTEPLLQGDSAAAVLSVIPKLSHNCVKLLFVNSSPLPVRNFSAKP